MGDAPPFSATKRLEPGSKYEQEIIINFRQSGNSFKTTLQFDIFVKKPYKQIKITEVWYFYEGKNGSLSKDTIFKLPECIIEEPEDPGCYLSQNGYFWTFIKDIKLPGEDFQKIFKDKKPGDKFTFTIEIEYSFDDGDTWILSIEYEVTAEKGRYISPFM